MLKYGKESSHIQEYTDVPPEAIKIVDTLYHGRGDRALIGSIWFHFSAVKTTEEHSHKGETAIMYCQVTGAGKQLFIKWSDDKVVFLICKA